MRVERDVQAIRLEKLRLFLDGIAERGLASIAATARSPLVKHILDCRTAIASVDGELVAVGRPGANHMPTCLAAVRREYAGRVRPGDVFIMNDPFDGGAHVPCVWTGRPVFDGERQVAWVLASTHQVDFGGRVPGSMAADSTEIYQEGLRLPPLRLFEDDEPVDAIFSIIALNVRIPDMVLGDIHGGIASLRTMERELLEVVRKMGGAEIFAADVAALLDLSEAMSRRMLAAIPDGTGEWIEKVDCTLEDDATEIRVKIVKSGDAVTIDFAGTSPQVASAINSTWSYTQNLAAEVLRIVAGIDLPHNEGALRPITVSAPLGSLMNPIPPASVGARAIVVQPAQYALLGAFASIVPSKVPACMVALETAITFSGKLPDGGAYLHTEQFPGSGGGGPNADADDGTLAGLGSGTANAPVEVVENETPALRVEAYGFVPDTGGAGKYRGGLAVRRAIRALVDGVNVNVRPGRTRVAPYGLFGGNAGTPARQRVLRAGGEQAKLPSLASFRLDAGDVFIFESAGAGGYGSPSERDADSVATDVRDRRLTPEHAAAHYPQYGARRA